MSDTLQALLLILAVAYPITLAVASIGGVFLAGRALSPIDSLTRLARRISAEDLSERLDMHLPDDEVGRLARTFDEMIARLDEAFRRQRQFTADASHELRTPLTAIKGQAEVALSKSRDAAAYREVLQTVNEEVDRLIRMVGSLLTLARADAGQIPIASEAVSLGDLVTAAVEQVRPMAEQREIEIGVNPGSAITLQADQDLLLQLVLNLLDNAVKYTPSGGAVTAGWGVDGDHAQLRVRDTGIGIAEEHKERIFDRFYRVDRSRSRAEGGAGWGSASAAALHSGFIPTSCCGSSLAPEGTAHWKKEVTIHEHNETPVSCGRPGGHHCARLQRLHPDRGAPAMTSLSRSDASLQMAPATPSGGWIVVAAQELRDVWLSARGPIIVLVFSLLLSLLTYLAATNKELNIIDQKDTVNLVI